MFEVNIHPVERIFRGLVGLFGPRSLSPHASRLASVAASSYFWDRLLIFWGPKSIWGLIGLLPLITALAGWCPPYSWLGINTCRLGKKSP